MGSKNKFKLREMTRADLNKVLDIERKSFEQPYTREIFEQELKIKVANLWVATHRKNILGYIDFWVVADEVELISIAVHPQFKRMGVGEMLLREMIHFVELKGLSFIYLDVRESNLTAQKLYSKFGFSKVGVRRRYYSDNQEDAIIMKKEIYAG